MKYLTDVIKPLDYLGWGDSDIYIQAPTGCGKTYFILHNIVPMAMQRGSARSGFIYSNCLSQFSSTSSG